MDTVGRKLAKRLGPLVVWVFPSIGPVRITPPRTSYTSYPEEPTLPHVTFPVRLRLPRLFIPWTFAPAFPATVKLQKK